MDAGYVQVYRQLYNQHWWWRTRETAVLGAIREFHEPSPDDCVLDIGCGDGLFFDRLKDFGSVEGIEVDPLAVSETGPYRRQIHVGPFDDSFVTTRRYRLITMLDVLEHLDDPTAAAKLVRTLLTPDGLFVLTVPAFQTLWTGHDTMNQHRTRFTRATLRAVLDAAQLEIVASRYLFHWLAAAKLIIRGLECVRGPDQSPPKLPSPFINRLLGTLTTWELRRGKGLGLPFGSSLLMLARPAGAMGRNSN
ncbi:bifunctional 3-demethylubiquinone-9 3-methyltransferase/ 2-octaprenyl-6-hydroxy phenol methylase [Planctopirus ephydatiae]|uniref:Bifunctional 3-demethylubiquinone-9 3-methyltransferase/ 2-octaprenyl-6-hydroxy phenol methylase n=1 Tax=Planctopirus ephydatiae TaxID=2528019 RepID=A0A518GMM1_9PLAN|nr:class I SAM-dependent methyltransferase [Planctopirus ephydatiae]QDV29794.1 bifunctional 3-demethylubiquinone-9 3-methyltransferase/ 2-octaprenyl-6-hydroxy phenol methylase [Planctopirus ephydatiae]